MSTVPRVAARREAGALAVPCLSAGNIGGAQGDIRTVKA
jgi:hypothetical protein